jgi:hypothetical protein
MHPLISHLEDLKDSEIDSKINDLTKKYFQSTNPALKQQVAMALDSYKEEQAKRRHAEWQKMVDNRDKSLDKLINIQ